MVESVALKIFGDEHCTGYHSPGHPERPARIIRTREKLKHQHELPIEWLPPGKVEDAAILRAHTPEHLARLRVPHDFDADTAYHPHIADFARRSVAAALSAQEAARAGEAAFTLMRPPGHHATADEAMGFCYLNSIAIAALAAQAAGTARVAVFDFDVHHGNGTEAILVNRPDLAFYSIHQYPCYPGTGTEHVGNNCFNYPVAPYTPRPAYRKVLSTAMEAMRKFKPDLIAVSAGFDAYAHDPIAQETLEAEDFHWIGQQLRHLGIPLLSVLEGGYSDDLGELVLAYLKGVAGK